LKIYGEDTCTREYFKAGVHKNNIRLKSVMKITLLIFLASHLIEEVTAFWKLVLLPLTGKCVKHNLLG
jgi:hypothetical protein